MAIPRSRRPPHPGHGSGRRRATPPGTSPGRPGRPGPTSGAGAAEPAARACWSYRIPNAWVPLGHRRQQLGVGRHPIGVALMPDCRTRRRRGSRKPRGEGNAQLAPAADQRQVDLVDDLGQDAVGDGGGAAGDVLVAQEHDGDGGDPVEGFWRASPRRRRGPGRSARCRSRVRGLLPGAAPGAGSSRASQQAAEDVAGGRGQVAVGAAQQLQDVAAQLTGVG